MEGFRFQAFTLCTSYLSLFTVNDLPANYESEMNQQAGIQQLQMKINRDLILFPAQISVNQCHEFTFFSPTLHVDL